MKKQLSILLFLTFIVTGVWASENLNLISATTTAPPAKTDVNIPASTSASVTVQNTLHAEPLANTVNPLEVVKKPESWLNKKINVTARFGKFATLGLDYKPALRSSETYIAFLILRPDTDKNIPLSEMKLFIKRSAAEKLTGLKEGDTVQFTGTVFSSALGDPWVDVEKLEKIKKDVKQ